MSDKTKIEWTEMSDKTKIEWTEATWSPVTGCTRVSDGCLNCYIERTPPFRMAHRRFDGDRIGATTGVQLHHDRMLVPTRWRKPRKVFVCSLADLFHDDVPEHFIGSVFDIMARCPQHTFQVLTKRPARMRALLTKWATQVPDDLQHRYKAAFRAHDGLWAMVDQWPLPNVWAGVTVESAEYLWRIDKLRETPAAVRFLSLEPLLGSLPDLDLTGIDWVITGGESGPGARPAHPQWFRSIRDQCQAAGVAYLHKQHGEWIEDVTLRPGDPERGIEPYRVLNVPSDAKDRKRCAMHLSGGTALTPDNPFNPFRAGHGGWTAMRRVGKTRAGRVLDGRTWDEYPEVTG